MNKQEQLIADTLGENDGGRFALAAAAHARRRHAVRHAGVVAGVAAALVAVFFVIRQPRPKPSVAIAAPAPAFEIISDQELLAQLKDQPVLILKNPTGITSVVFLADKADRRL